MNNSLTGSFQSLAESHYRKSAVAAMGSVPSSEEAVSGWLRRIAPSSGDFALIFLKGFPEDDGGMTVFAPTPALEAFFEANKESSTFRRGIESSMYDEIFQPAQRLVFAGEERRVLFAPAHDGETGDVTGTAV